ncbi:MAG: divergent polysaccharide deacetylase family protein [Parvularculaceae bacterium]
MSRLTWAWLGVAALSAGAAGVFYYSSRSGEGVGRVALPVGKVETLARVITPPPARDDHEERIPAPALRDDVANDGFVGGVMEDDSGEGLTLIYPGENDLYADETGEGDAEFGFSADDVVITIPGAASRGAAPAVAASLTRVVTPIPDPDPELMRKSALGATPRVAPDGRRASRYYARPYRGEKGEPKVALVVSGLGLNPSVTERAIDNLPPEISLSFAPYSKDLAFWTEKARKAGHEVIIELPMEGYGPNQEALGPAALMTARSADDNLQRLDWLMSRFGAYAAATNYQGAKFAADAAAIGPVLRKLDEAGVGYIDDTGAAERAGARADLATVTRMIPSATHEDDRAIVRRELAALTEIAVRDGAALGKTYAYAATIDEIAEWSKGLEKAGVSPAPATALLRRGGGAR